MIYEYDARTKDICKCVIGNDETGAMAEVLLRYHHHYRLDNGVMVKNQWILEEEGKLLYRSKNIGQAKYRADLYLKKKYATHLSG